MDAATVIVVVDDEEAIGIPAGRPWSGCGTRGDGSKTVSRP